MGKHSLSAQPPPSAAVEWTLPNTHTLLLLTLSPCPKTAPKNPREPQSAPWPLKTLPPLQLFPLNPCPIPDPQPPINPPDSPIFSFFQPHQLTQTSLAHSFSMYTSTRPTFCSYGRTFSWTSISSTGLLHHCVPHFAYMLCYSCSHFCPIDLLAGIHFSNICVHHQSNFKFWPHIRQWSGVLYNILSHVGAQLCEGNKLLLLTLLHRLRALLPIFW